MWTLPTVEWVYLKTEKATVKSTIRMHAERVKRLARGEEVIVVRSVYSPKDKRFATNRRLRRAQLRELRRYIKNMGPQIRRQQKQIEKALDEEFKKKRRGKAKLDASEERSAGGVILPKGVRDTRKTRKAKGAKGA